MVRPVGFTDENARDWLRVAAGEVGHYQSTILAMACGEARRECTHHSQIVPAIVKHAVIFETRAQSLAEWTRPLALPKPHRDPMPRHVFERIVAERGRELSSLLDCGEIISLGSGKFELRAGA